MVGRAFLPSVYPATNPLCRLYAMTDGTLDPSAEGAALCVYDPQEGVISSFEWITDAEAEGKVLLNENDVIAQVKDKCGLDKRLNYNLSKKDDQHVTESPKEKEDAIMDAFRHLVRVKTVQGVLYPPCRTEDRATLRSDPSADPSHGRAERKKQFRPLPFNQILYQLFEFTQNLTRSLYDKQEQIYGGIL